MLGVATITRLGANRRPSGVEKKLETMVSGEPNDFYPNLLSPVFNVIAILLSAASRRVFLNIPKHLRLRESRARRRGEYW